MSSSATPEWMSSLVILFEVWESRLSTCLNYGALLSESAPTWLGSMFWRRVCLLSVSRIIGRNLPPKRKEKSDFPVGCLQMTRKRFGKLLAGRQTWYPESKIWFYINPANSIEPEGLMEKQKIYYTNYCPTLIFLLIRRPLFQNVFLIFLIFSIFHTFI